MATEIKTTNSLLNLNPIRKKIGRSLLRWLVFLPLAAIVSILLIYIVSRAFTHESDQFNFPIEWIPYQITTANFTHIFADVTLPVMKWFANSLIIATVGTIIVFSCRRAAVVPSPAWNSPGKDNCSRCCFSA